MSWVKHQAQLDHHHIPAELTTLQKPGNVCLDNSGIHHLMSSVQEQMRKKCQTITWIRKSSSVGMIHVRNRQKYPADGYMWGMAS